MKAQNSSEAKERIFNIVAGIASSFGSPARLKILQILAQAPRSVDAVAGITGETVANTSQHLQRLLREGLVSVRKDKLSRIYRLSDERVALLIEQLLDLAESISRDLVHAESELIDEELHSPRDFASVLEEVENRKAVLIDVRENYEAQQSPVEGAVSLPLEILKEKVSTLAKSKSYYIFCRGRLCERASKGVQILRSAGLRAYRLKESPIAIKGKSKPPA